MKTRLSALLYPIFARLNSWFPNTIAHNGLEIPCGHFCGHFGAVILHTEFYQHRLPMPASSPSSIGNSLIMVEWPVKQTELWKFKDMGTELCAISSNKVRNDIPRADSTVNLQHQQTNGNIILGTSAFDSPVSGWRSLLEWAHIAETFLSLTNYAG